MGVSRRGVQTSDNLASFSPHFAGHRDNTRFFLQGYSTVNKIVKCVVLVERRQVNTEPKGKQILLWPRLVAPGIGVAGFPATL